MYFRKAVLRITHMAKAINVDQLCGVFIREKSNLQVTSKNGDFDVEIIVRQISNFLQIQEISSFCIRSQLIKSRIEKIYFVLS
jgi:hypothetical protein